MDIADNWITFCNMSLEDRAKFLASQKPHLMARLWLYPADRSTRSSPILPGQSIPCVVNKTKIPEARDGAPILTGGAMELGETREVGFFFLAGENALSFFDSSDKFYLWERGYIGEAAIIRTKR